MFKKCHRVCSRGGSTAPRSDGLRKRAACVPARRQIALPMSRLAPSCTAGLAGWQSRHQACLRLHDSDTERPAMEGIPGTAWGHPRPSQNLTVGDKWGLRRQKISFNTLWRASNKVGRVFFSSQERMVSIILKYFWRAYRILNRFWGNSLHTYTSTCVPRGSGFVVAVLGFTSWRRDLDLSSDVCHVNRVFINPAAWYKTWFSKLYYEFIMQDLLWGCVPSDWPVILMDVFAPSRDMQSKSAQKWAGRASQDSTVTGTVMR